MHITKQQALELEREHLGFNFDFHEDTQTYHCRFCGRKVGWHTEGYGFQFSSCCEGDEKIGKCYDCWAEEHYKEDEEDD